MASRMWWIAASAVLVVTGCSTTDVNPRAARVHTGYVDFYTERDSELWWEVKCLSPKSGKMETVFCDYNTLPGPILRLAARPGNQRFQVWFSNLATEGPIAVPVEVVDAKVTPVHVTLTSASSTTVQTKVYRFGGSAKGYARGTKVVSEQNEVYRINAAVEAPRPYLPKEQMPYFSPGAK